MKRGPHGEDPARPEAYRGCHICLLTQHGKEEVIGPLFLEALGAQVQLVGGYDTDLLGTFTRERPRYGTQLEAARKKARIGMERSGLPLGLASEGAFGPGPYGLAPWNIELVVLIDDLRKIELVGHAQGPAQHGHERVSTWEELEAFARRAGFPEHGLVLRPNDDSDPRIQKGLRDWGALREAFVGARRHASAGEVFVENELRAHMNPTRMKNIAAATQDLIQRMQSLCPGCAAPGFWVVERIPGLPCADCGTPTREPRAERWSCVACEHQEIREVPASRLADPGRCDECNP